MLAWASPAGAAQLLKDPSFEGSSAVSGQGGNSPSWFEADTVFGSPLCTQGEPALCGDGNPSPPLGDGPMAPRTGLWFAWFGGAPDGAAQSSSLAQSITIPRGKAKLSFFFKQPTTGGDGDEVFSATIDSTTVFTATKDTPGFLTAYGEVSRDVSRFANGKPHTLTLSFTNPTDNAGNRLVNTAVDDVGLLSRPCKKKKGKKGAAAARSKCKKKKKK